MLGVKFGMAKSESTASCGDESSRSEAAAASLALGRVGGWGLRGNSGGANVGG